MRILVIDGPSIFSFHQYLIDHHYHVQGKPNYGALLETMERGLPGESFNPKVACVSISFEHEGQAKFTNFLEHQGFVVDATDYRDAFVLPDKSSPYQRLSTRITYLAGLYAHKRPHFVAVTDAFDVYYPLLDLVQNRGCQATLAFFASGLEPRWQRAGLFADDSPVKFFDLDPFAKKILGVELGSRCSPKAARMGLSSLSI